MGKTRRQQATIFVCRKKVEHEGVGEILLSGEGVEAMQKNVHEKSKLFM